MRFSRIHHTSSTLAFQPLIFSLLAILLIHQIDPWTFPLPLRSKNSNINKLFSNKDKTIRGNKYGLKNNSTILDPFEVAEIVGVKPCSTAPYWVWKFAWRLHGAVLPILHFADKAKPRDSKYSLKVLWCKAIASMDRHSKVFDHYWTYDTLPASSRWLLRLLPKRFFPRLHHSNIEARTAYLNSIIQTEIDRVLLSNNVMNDNANIATMQLISLGAGYDVRCSRLISQYSSSDVTIDAYEFDLDNVIQSKRLILDRLKRRRPETQHPTLRTMDLNDLEGAVKPTLEEILAKNATATTHTIFISEGVMIYLNPGIPSGLLKMLRDSIVLNTNNGTASLCFADRLENVPAGDINAAKTELSNAGWELIDFLPKPGLARHMGVARLIPI